MLITEPMWGRSRSLPFRISAGLPPPAYLQPCASRMDQRTIAAGITSLVLLPPWGLRVGRSAVARRDVGGDLGPAVRLPNSPEIGEVARFWFARPGNNVSVGPYAVDADELVGRGCLPKRQRQSRVAAARQQRGS